MIYLSSPYTHKDRNVMIERYVQALCATADLTSKGHIVYSPIVHSHWLDQFDAVDKSVDSWLRIDTDFIQACEKLFVLKIDGWDESVGVKREMEIATAMGKPVQLLFPEAAYRLAERARTMRGDGANRLEIAAVLKVGVELVKLIEVLDESRYLKEAPDDIVLDEEAMKGKTYQENGKNKGKVTKAMKKKMADMRASGDTLQKIANALDVSPATVIYWLKKGR